MSNQGIQRCSMLNSRRRFRGWPASLVRFMRFERKHIKSNERYTVGQHKSVRFSRFTRKIASSPSTFFLISQKMATPRRPLGTISGNRKPGEELSPYLRGRIVGKYEEGRNKVYITKDLKLAESIVRSTLLLDLQRNEGKTKSCPNVPLKYS